MLTTDARINVMERDAQLFEQYPVVPGVLVCTYVLVIEGKNKTSTELKTAKIEHGNEFKNKSKSTLITLHV